MTTILLLDAMKNGEYPARATFADKGPHGLRSGSSRKPAAELEEDARTTLDAGAGRTLTDTEWERMRSKLVAFVGILYTWDRETSASRRGNVETLCRREP